jgi:hypothetical protein
MNQQQTPQPARQVERRKSPRLPVRGRLLACLVESDRPLRIREIGFGGFATESVEPLPLSVLHHVQFTSQNDESAVLPALTLHSWPSCLSDGTPCYVTGFEFRPDEPAKAQEIVQMLIETVTAPGLYTAE